MLISFKETSSANSDQHLFGVSNMYMLFSSSGLSLKRYCLNFSHVTIHATHYVHHNVLNAISFDE